MQNSKAHVTMDMTQAEVHSKTSYDVDAHFFQQNGKFFLFFDEESDEGHVTKCRFELNDETLRLRRNGQMIMEQTHVKNQKTKGYIKTPFGHLDTHLQTFQLALKKDGGNYHLDLGYDLYTEGQKSGTYLLTIVIALKEALIS